MKKIGFIGLGHMGSRMASQLVKAHVPLVGYDVNPDNVKKVGIKESSSISSLTQESDIILLSLPETRIVESVVEGDSGILSAVKENQIIVDLGTSSPDSTKRLHGLFKEKRAWYVDAGISGGAAAAEKGALTLMVGGDEVAINQLDWVFDIISKKSIVMGASGAGHTTKLLNNFLNAISLSATAEVMVAGKKANLDLHSLLEVLNNSSGVNFATLNRFPRIVDGDYLEGGLTVKLMSKDIRLYIDHVASLGVASLNASAPMASFGLAMEMGYGDVISNRVVDAIGDVSGGVRLSTTNK